MSGAATISQTNTSTKAFAAHWKKRRSTATTSVIQEFRTAGLSAAYRLLNAKMAFRRRRVKTLEKLGAMIDMGMTNDDAISTLYMQATRNGTYPNTALGFVFGTWMIRSKEGQSLADITAGWLTDDAKPMLRAGEESSDIKGAIDRYVYVSEKKAEMNRTVRDILKAPAMNTFLIIIYLWVIAYKMTPTFAEAVPRSLWTGSLYWVALLGDLVKDYLIYVLIIIAALTAFITWSMNNLLGRARIVLDRFPPWSIYRQLYGTNFMLSFASLYAAGMKDQDIILTLMASANKYYSERLSGILVHIKRGEKIGDSLHKAKFEFPDNELVADMMVYQRLPDLPTILQKVSYQFTEKNIVNVRAATNIIAGLLAFFSFVIVALMTESNFAFSSLVSSYLQH
jgi:type II secretory pathway component PulF